MMEQFIDGLIKTSPIAVAMLIVVIVYVRSERQSREAFLAVLEKRDALLSTISERCHATQRETTKQTTDALLETSRMLGQVTRVLARVNGVTGGH